MNTQTLELDVSKPQTSGNVIRIGQGESGGTTIKATIYDNGSALTLTNYTANLIVRLPDKVHYYRSSATVSGSTVTHKCDESKLASVAGYTDEAYFEFANGGTTIQTERFALDILRSALTNAQAGTSYDNRIEQMLKEGKAATTAANSAATKATSAASSATTAAGTANTAATTANSAATSATEAATKATSAASSVDESKAKAEAAAADATAAAAEARGAIGRDKNLYLDFDEVDGVKYLTLVDKEEENDN